MGTGVFRKYGLGSGLSGLSALIQSGIDYIKTVLGILAASLIAYWPQNETAGLVADNAEGTSARDGTYVGVTLADDETGPFETPAPLYDGVNDCTDIYSVSFNAAFDPTLFTVAIWAKVANAGIWTSGAAQRILRLAVDNSNQIIIEKAAANNTLRFVYRAGGTLKEVNHSTSSTDWIFALMTVSKADDEMKAYVDGSQTGATQNGLGVWAGALNSARCVIGAFDTMPTTPFNGWLVHVPVWDAVLAQPDITTLANP